MNLRAEQQILLKDIFAATVNPSDHGATYLPEFASLVAQLGSNASLVEHSSYFDSMLIELLRVPGRNILEHLEDCWNRAEVALGKTWNSSAEAQEFIKYSLEIVKNFVALALQEPELFPDQLQTDPHAPAAATKPLEVAMKLLTHIEHRGYNEALFAVVAESIGEQFTEEFLQVLLARQRFQTVLDPKAFTYLSLLVDLLADPRTRARLLALPSPGHVDQSPLGLFLRLSVLGQAVGNYHQEKVAVQRFEERLADELGAERLSKEKMKFYTNLQEEFFSKLTEGYKALLKKDTQREFLGWNYRLLLANAGRMKLGARLYNADNSMLSHDGTLLNVYACFLNLSKVIASRSDQKYRSIDPHYFRCHEQAVLMKYEPINAKAGRRGEERREFGTITEFFFLSLQFLHLGVCGAMDNFSEFSDIKKNLEKELARLPPNHPLLKKYQYELAKAQSKVVRYYLLLFQDEALIKNTVQLLDLLLEVLPGWLGFGFDGEGGLLREGEGELACYLPELLLTVVHKYHSTNFSYKQGYLQLLGRDHLAHILGLVCFLLSEQELVSNPYVAANYVELLFLFLHDSKAGLMQEVFAESRAALRNLTHGLILFYCSIAITGRSNQFYEKFKYRFYANKIFTSLWAHEGYRQDLKKYFQTPLFEKFLNMVMTDTTYCFDETNENYEKFKQLEARKAEGPLSPEELKNEEMVERIIGSTLSQSTSNLKLMRDLSVWSPETFLTEADKSTAVPLLNNILKTFVDPGAFPSNRQLVTKFKFESAPALADLVYIYANLNVNDILSSEIVKDGRNYKKEYFSKALQKASNEHYSSIDILEKFEALIEKLSTAENEEEDEEEIYGEIPEKYLCQLMNTLLKDPVLLPSSRIIVDRVAIHRSLLSMAQDPFNRQPLKEEELIPQKQLKEEIEQWKKRRLEELKKGGKEVKYGKIAATRKEESEGVFGNNPLIEEE